MFSLQKRVFCKDNSEIVRKQRTSISKIPFHFNWTIFLRQRVAKTIIMPAKRRKIKIDFNFFAPFPRTSPTWRWVLLGPDYQNQNVSIHIWPFYIRLLMKWKMVANSPDEGRKVCNIGPWSGSDWIRVMAKTPANTDTCNFKTQDKNCISDSGHKCQSLCL